MLLSLKKDVDESLSPPEKQHLLVMQLHSAHDAVRQQLDRILSDVERCLHLVVRHLESFLVNENVSEDDRERLQHDAATLLLPDLKRMEQLPLSPEALGPLAKSRANFLSMLSRYGHLVTQQGQ